MGHRGSCSRSSQSRILRVLHSREQRRPKLYRSRVSRWLCSQRCMHRKLLARAAAVVETAAAVTRAATAKRAATKAAAMAATRVAAATEAMMAMAATPAAVPRAVGMEAERAGVVRTARSSQCSHSLEPRARYTAAGRSEHRTSSRGIPCRSSACSAGSREVAAVRAAAHRVARAALRVEAVTVAAVMARAAVATEGSVATAEAASAVKVRMATAAEVACRQRPRASAATAAGRNCRG